VNASSLHESSGRSLALVGAALFAGAAAWSAVTALIAGTAPAPAAGMILGCGVTVGLCWLAGSRWPLLVPAGLVAAAVLLVAMNVETTLRSHPLQGPFGYANATAAFLVQAIIAAVMLIVSARPGAVRILAATATIGFAGVLVVTRSWTAILSLPVVLLLALIVERERGGRAAVMVAAGLFVAALAVTVALGAIRLGTGTGPLDRLVQGTISEGRPQLWHEALSITAARPLVGVGPGAFAVTSPTAASDLDLRWAHNEYLQAGAESGVLGYLLATGIFLWGFAALWMGSPGRIGALGAAALALLGIHASVDYVLHFPAVAVAGAALLGASVGASRLSADLVAPRADPVPTGGLA
jgi:O-antigen ligase